MEHALGAPIEDAVIVLVAVAVRLRVLDHHVMVRQLVSACEIKPVKNALDPFAAQVRADVVAGQPSARGDRVRDEIAAPAQLRAHARNVKCSRALVLELAVLHRSAGAENHVRYRVGEIRRVHGAGVAFEDGDTAALPGHDEVARMPGCACLFRRRYEQQVDGRWDGLSGGNLDEGAILEEGRVQGGKGPVLLERAAGQMLFNGRGIRGQRRSQAADDNAWRLLV